MRKIFLVLAVVAMAVPAYADTSLGFFGVTSDGAFDNYRSGQLGGYTNNGSGGATRMMKGNQHMGFMSLYGAVADGSGDTLNTLVMANGGWANPLLKFNLRFKATGALPPLGLTDTGLPTGRQVGAWIVSVRVGSQAGAGGLVEDLGASTGGDFAYSAPAGGFQGASELVAFRGAQEYLGTGAGFINFGEGISGGPDGTAPGTAWFTPAGATGAHSPGGSANQAVQWAGGSGIPAVVGYNAGKDTWALEWLIGGYGNNGAMRAGGATGTGTNDWADSGQIVARDALNKPIIVTAAYNNSADPRTGLVSPDNVAIPLDAVFVLDLATNAENRGFVFNNNVDALGNIFSAGVPNANVGFYTNQQGGVMHPYLEVVLIPEPMTLVLLGLGGLALIRRRR